MLGRGLPTVGTKSPQKQGGLPWQRKGDGSTHSRGLKIKGYCTRVVVNANRVAVLLGILEEAVNKQLGAAQ